MCRQVPDQAGAVLRGDPGGGGRQSRAGRREQLRRRRVGQQGVRPGGAHPRRGGRGRGGWRAGGRPLRVGGIVLSAGVLLSQPGGQQPAAQESGELKQHHPPAGEGSQPGRAARVGVLRRRGGSRRKETFLMCS